MAKATAFIDLHTDADKVWQLIGGFDALPDWLPFIPQSTLSEGGRGRTLKSVDGDTIIERLLDFNEAGCSYTILLGPAPMRDYQSTELPRRYRGAESAEGAPSQARRQR
ncbi:SRPBCC family protein [Pseudomonas sp. ATCC 13867]|nr:SRPBCC family protein [Pseudomonas sp. ATCC 13867]